MSKLTLSFLYANVGEEVCRQLGGENSYRQVFDENIADKIRRFQEGKVSRADITPVMDAFLEKACPAARSKPQIAQWVCKQYLSHRHNGEPIKAEDLYKIGENIQYFDSLKKSDAFKQSGASADLTQYKTYASFEEMLEPHRRLKEEKEALAKTLHMSSEEKGRIAAETTVLYEGPEGKVVVPHTPEASMHWGSNTKWCIAGRSYAKEYFPQYNKKSPVIFILPQGQQDNKVALVDKTLWNSSDYTIEGLPQKHHDLMQKCLAGLSEGAREGIASWIPDAVNNVISEDIAKGNVREEERAELNARDNAANEAAKWQDREFVLNAVQQRGMSLYRAAPEFKEDREIVLAAVKNHGPALHYASREFLDDEEIVFIAAQKGAISLEKVSERLRDNREIVLAAVNSFGINLKYASERLQNDRDIIIAAIGKYGSVLQYTSAECRDDREIVLASVLAWSSSLQYASERLRDDSEVVRAAVQASPWALEYASERLRGDREIVIEAARNYNSVLQHASEEIQNDKNLVLELNSQEHSRPYIPKPLQDDRKVVLAAVRKDGLALMNASRALRNDRELILAAVESRPEALGFASDEIRYDKGFIIHLLETAGSFSFRMSSDKEARMWKPDDRTLAICQVKALEHMLKAGNKEEFSKYARHCNFAWGDPETLFASDEVAMMERIKTKAAAEQSAPTSKNGAHRPKL
jgi:hypothetical protein